MGGEFGTMRGAMEQMKSDAAHPVTASPILRPKRTR
jgi:hypothetical protein